MTVASRDGTALVGGEHPRGGLEGDDASAPVDLDPLDGSGAGHLSTHGGRNPCECLVDPVDETGPVEGPHLGRVGDDDECGGCATQRRHARGGGSRHEDRAQGIMAPLGEGAWVPRCRGAPARGHLAPARGHIVRTRLHTGVEHRVDEPLELRPDLHGEFAGEADGAVPPGPQAQEPVQRRIVQGQVIGFGAVGVQDQRPRLCHGRHLREGHRDPSGVGVLSEAPAGGRADECLLGSGDVREVSAPQHRGQERRGDDLDGVRPECAVGACRVDQGEWSGKNLTGEGRVTT